MNQLNKILVVGATGRQGGAVVDAFLSGEFGEFELFGLTRDVTSDAAQALETRGVSLIEGDMTDIDSLVAAFEGMDAVFGVTTFFEVGADGEREQGRNLVEAAERTDIEYVVFSSVGSADADTGLAHFESKAATERLLAESDIPATVLRPVFFMQNLGMSLGTIEDGQLALPLAEGVELAMIDARDIGRAAAVAFADPDAFVGETITLAGEELTLEATAERLSAYLNREIEPVHLDVDDVRPTQGDEMADMFAWFNAGGYTVDIPAIEDTLGIEMTSFDGFLADSELFTPLKPVR